MIDVFQIDEHSDMPKYRQLESAIADGVATGKLEKNTKLPSINEVASYFTLSRDTVVKAYNLLKERGIIISTHGKGYFTTGEFKAPKHKVFMLFNELNAYKEVLHKSIITELGDEAEIETCFHNHNIEVFEYLIDKALGNFTHFIIMPTFNAHQDRVWHAIQKIPPRKLFLLDRHIAHTQGGSIFQDFCKDAYTGFKQLAPRISRYQKICLLYHSSFMHPYASVEGIKQFGQENKLPVVLSENVERVEQGTLYVCFRDTELVDLVKLGNLEQLLPGRDYGILSFNDSPMKEIIHHGITVISTNFRAMGKQVSEMVLNGYQKQVPNPVKIIERNSI